jgi:hypothetical protein
MESNDLQGEIRQKKNDLQGVFCRLGAPVLGSRQWPSSSCGPVTALHALLLQKEELILFLLQQ